MKLALSIKSILALAIVILFTQNPLFSQEIHRCNTMEHLQSKIDKDPSIIERRKQLEKEFQEYINNPLRETDGDVVIIPIVFHVIHNGDAVGSGENIADLYIQAQLDQLNDDFRRTNSDADGTWPQAADTDVEFCLASIDPDGNPTTGIVRHNISGGPWSSGNFDSTVKPATVWDRDNYCNFWIADLSGGLLGYAQFPDPSDDPDTDGVVCLYTSVGSIATPNPSGGVYDQGRTGTHEIGHWLNLFHIWGDDGTSCAGSDQCVDTPNQSSSTSGCPSGVQTDACSANSPGYMYQNYMDYSYDECMNIFTDDQRTRMQATLNGFRVSLKTASCGAPAAPVADFSPDSGTEILCGSTADISFINQSSGLPDTYAWTFSGAGVSPTSSTLPNPTVTVTASGNVTATLTVTNAIDTDTHTGVIAIDLRPLSDPFCQTSPCLDFDGGPYNSLNFGDACPQDGCPITTATFEVWSNESYTLAGLIGGLDYTFEFCTGYSAATFAAVITIGEYDPVTDAAVPNSTVLSANDCTITFTAPFDGDFIAVLSEDGNCGGAQGNTDNGDPTFTCVSDCASVCGLLFTDSGGINFNYRSGQDRTYVMCPDNPTCELVEVAFSSFDVRTNDPLSAYDGDDITAPLIGTYVGSTSPGTLTSTHPSGCLTFRFISSASGTDPGWEATVTCLDNGSCSSDCPDDYAGINGLNGIEDGTGGMNGDGDYETNGAIESTQNIVGGSVDYDSGISIDLNSGFETDPAAEVDIFIDGCNNGGGGNTLNGQVEDERRRTLNGVSRKNKEKQIRTY